MNRFKLLLKKYGIMLVAKIYPIQKGTIVFTSYNGHYSDSPRNISEMIHFLAPDLQIIWLVEKKYIPFVPSYAKCIDISSKEAILYYGKAQVLIDNVYAEKSTELHEKGFLARSKYSFLVWLKRKKNQKIYTFWHGTPLKRMGRDQIGNSIIDFSCHNTTMILGNQYTLDIMRHITFGKIRMLLLGCPRNDKLFLGEQQIKLLKEKISFPQNKRIVLYAPTFRSSGTCIDKTSILRSGINQLNSFDIDALLNTLQKKFGDEWVLVCRFHYHVANHIDWNSLNKKYPNKIINGNIFDDMSDYLTLADLLITDASSCMFDYALTRKPCFLFFPDLEHYKNEERGFYREIGSLPFAISMSFEQLLESIIQFDHKSYQNGIHKLMDGMGFIDKTSSSLKIAEFILNENKLKNDRTIA